MGFCAAAAWSRNPANLEANAAFPRRCCSNNQHSDSLDLAACLAACLPCLACLAACPAWPVTVPAWPGLPRCLPGLACLAACLACIAARLASPASLPIWPGQPRCLPCLAWPGLSRCLAGLACLAVLAGCAVDEVLVCLLSWFLFLPLLLVLVARALTSGLAHSPNLAH